MMYEPFNDKQRKKIEFWDGVYLVATLAGLTILFVIACSLWGGK